ncbi:MAG: hypothetical protein K8R92_00770 [Planctomycetes bacterium]|nr:hypothetical protein [Planctomycetota bacterium]
MLEFIAKLFATERQEWLHAFWQEKPISISKMKTPGGSTVTKVKLCLDICFSIKDGEVVVHDVCLSKRSGGIMGATRTGGHNATADRTGETWTLSPKIGVCKEDLIGWAKAESVLMGGLLRRTMWAKWHNPKAF